MSEPNRFAQLAALLEKSYTPSGLQQDEVQDFERWKATMTGERLVGEGASISTLVRKGLVECGAAYGKLRRLERGDLYVEIIPAPGSVFARTEREPLVRLWTEEFAYHLGARHGVARHEGRFTWLLVAEQSRFWEAFEYSIVAEGDEFVLRHPAFEKAWGNGL